MVPRMMNQHPIVYKRIMPAEYEVIELYPAQIMQSAKLKIIVWQWI